MILQATGLNFSKLLKAALASFWEKFFRAFEENIFTLRSVSKTDNRVKIWIAQRNHSETEQINHSKLFNTEKKMERNGIEETSKRWTFLRERSCAAVGKTSLPIWRILIVIVSVFFFRLLLNLWQMMQRKREPQTHRENIYQSLFFYYSFF